MNTYAFTYRVVVRFTHEIEAESLEAAKLRAVELLAYPKSDPDFEKSCIQAEADHDAVENVDSLESLVEVWTPKPDQGPGSGDCDVTYVKIDDVHYNDAEFVLDEMRRRA